MTTRPTKILPLVLKFEDWPEPDQIAWNSLFAEGMIFEDEGPCRWWSDGSRQKRRQGYGQWLSFLMREHPQDIAVPPTDRIAPDRIMAFIEDCRQRLAQRSVANLVQDIEALAPAIAPDLDWTWLKRLSKRLLQQVDPLALAPRHPITASEVFQWSLSRMEEVETLDLRLLRRAIWYRQALLIGLLISRPVRSRAFINIRLRKHLVSSPDGFTLRFAKEDMKDKRAHSYSLPRALFEPMTRYLEVHRPVLLAGNISDALWISQYGQPLTRDGYTRELAKITGRHLGVELRPHAFRSIAEPLRVCRRLQHLIRMEHHEQNNEQVFPGSARTCCTDGFEWRKAA